MATLNKTRCDYCREPGVVRFRYQGYLSSCIVRPQPKVTVIACAEHEGCVSWNSLRKSHADAPIERKINGKWVIDKS